MAKRKTREEKVAIFFLISKNRNDLTIDYPFSVPTKIKEKMEKNQLERDDARMLLLHCGPEKKKTQDK